MAASVIRPRCECLEEDTVSTESNFSNNGIDPEKHITAKGYLGTQRQRNYKNMSDDSSSEESFETGQNHTSTSVKGDLAVTSSQDLNRDLKVSSQGWHLLDTGEPCNDEEVVKGRLKFFFMNLADKFHVTRTVPFHLCLQVMLQSIIKAKI